MSEDAEVCPQNHVASPTKTIDRKFSVKSRKQTPLSGNLQGMQKDDLVNLLCTLEAEVQARDLIISAIVKGEIGCSLPLSHLLGDGQLASIVRAQDLTTEDEDDELWLGEPTAHLNHVVAYHQLVREKMQAMLQDQHKTILRQLEDERQIHAIDTAQGDQVTYMLEKDRERLTNEIEFQQSKLSKAEKERDKLMLTVEKMREEQQNEFNLLVNDCKMFAKQIVEQAQKEEQLQKDIEQEKRKNRVLSELMVEEQKKFKEWLRKIDDERTGQISLEQDRIGLEQRLIESEKRAKEAYQKYIQETHRVKQLEHEIKQIKLGLSSEDSFESGENSDELVESTNPLPPIYSNAKTHQLETATKTRKAYQISLETMSSTTKSKQGLSQEGSKVNFVNSPSSSPKIVRNAETMITEESSAHGQTMDMKSKRIPPPTPPRVSSITSKSVPVLTSDSEPNSDPSSENFVRCFSVGASSEVSVRTIERRQASVASPSHHSVFVAVASGYGWEFSDEEGLVISDSILDFVGEVNILPDSDWIFLTNAVKKIFSEKVPWKNLKDFEAGHLQASISRFELGSVAWTTTGYPAGVTPWNTVEQDKTKRVLNIRLKDETTSTCQSVAYSTSIANTLLEEYCRLIKKYKNVLFMTDDTLEAKHFISCFSHWLKTVDEMRGRESFVASVEENEVCSIVDLVRLLKEHGALVELGMEKRKSSTIMLIDVDFVVNRKLSSEIFAWLGKRGSDEAFYLSNGIGVNSPQYYLQTDVIVLAYATRSSMERLCQSMHRFFKLVDLPSTMPALLQRWLRQKATRNSRSALNFKEIDHWSSWISDVYRRSRNDLDKLEIKLDMPDLGLFLSAPFNEMESLKRWSENLWHHHFLPQVESSVEEQVSEASSGQQELLVQVAVNAFLEGAFLPGCPCKLNIN